MMDAAELGKILHDMYFNAPQGESTTMVHLFGVKYAAEIKSPANNAKKILSISGVPETYCAEIHKGVRLAKYVKLI